MSTPPRRRRTERRPQSDGIGSWLPTIGMGLGVIVAGLGIGALVAVLMQRTAPPKSAVIVATSTPVARSAPTRAPIALATFVPPRTPRPTPLRSIQVSAAPTPSAASTPSEQPTLNPTASSPATSAPTATGAPATAAPSPRGTPTRPAATPEPVVQSSTTPIGAPPGASSASASSASSTLAGASTRGTSTYEDRASAVVRRYVDALIRGDNKAAYAALGANGRTAAGVLTEQSFLDSSARIVSIKVTRIDAANASVGCEIASTKGHYYATYLVTAASDGPYISEHDYIKV